MGIPWTLHSWGRCLDAAYTSASSSSSSSSRDRSSNNLIAPLLKDFYLCRWQEEMNADFLYDTLPLMMEVFKNSRVSV